MRTGIRVLLTTFIVASVPQVWAAGSGPSSGGSSMPEMSSRVQTPEEKAKYAYNSGVKAVTKADKYEANAEKATDARKKDKANAEAQEKYKDALEKFEQAVQYAPSMYEAWNYVGYTHRKLGDYTDALTAYDRALSLKPSFPEAIEYRGEAYLRMKRFDDAKQAYLDLFGGNRALADKLLGSMKTWLDTQRTAGTDPAGTEDLARWIQERTQIAAQTASLTREGAGSSWR